MNILLISHYAGAPQYGMEYRSYYMAREWVRMGHRVLVVGANYSHLRREQPSVGRETLEGVDYWWLPTCRYEGNGAARVRSMVQFVWQVYRHSRELVNFHPQMVIASSVYTFDFYPCHHIARKTGARLVYEVHDLWPLSPMTIGGYSSRHPFIWLLQRAENYAYRHCDKVVSLLDKALPHMQRHGLNPDRFCCIPNGYTQEEWDDPSSPLPDPHAQLLASLHQQGRIIVGFAGGHTPSTALHVLIEAATEAQTLAPALSIVLVGQGPQKAELMALAQHHHLDNVHFLPPVSKECIPTLLQQFDICYAGGVHSPLHQYGTSFNKVIDYMMAARPVVFSVDEPNSLVQRANCGLQVEAENSQQVCKALLTLASLSPDERKAMGEQGHHYAQQHLEYHTLAQQFINSVIVNQ